MECHPGELGAGQPCVHIGARGKPAAIGDRHDQPRAFARCPGAIVMSGACLTPPAAAYRDRLFTTGATAHPDLRHLAAGEFAPAIEAALAAPGFTDRAPERRHTVGFGQHATSRVIDGMADAVRRGRIRRPVRIGGCDGAGTRRHDYRKRAEALADARAVLPLGGGKFRVLSRLRLGFHDIRTGPRLPGCMTPGILSRLNQRFGLRRIGTVRADGVAMAAA